MVCIIKIHDKMNHSYYTMRVWERSIVSYAEQGNCRKNRERGKRKGSFCRNIRFFDLLRKNIDFAFKLRYTVSKSILLYSLFKYLIFFYQKQTMKKEC